MEATLRRTGCAVRLVAAVVPDRPITRIIRSASGRGGFSLPGASAVGQEQQLWAAKTARMAEDESLKDEMRSQISAVRDRGAERRTIFIEPGTHPAHAEVQPPESTQKRGLIERLLRRR